MNVLFVSHTYLVKENQKKIEEIAKTGVELVLVIPKKWLNRDINFEFRFNDYDCGAQGFKTVATNAWFSRYGSLIFYPVFKMISLMKNFDPDIIHLEEEPWSLAALEFTLLKKWFRKKIIIFTWENLDRRLFLPQRIIRWYVLKHADFIIGGNKKSITIVKKYGFKGNHEIIPQLGIDTDHFTFKERDGNAGSEFIIGFIGRLVFQKGVTLLIEAVNLLKNENVKVLFVGTGPMEDKIIELSRRYNLQDKVVILKFIKHEKIPEELSKMDVLVLPSISTNFWKEQFGHVLIEAMSCGIPVIGSTCGEIPNIIDDSGLVFKEGDAQDLAEKITLLLRNKKLYEDLRLKGRNRVIREYTHKKIAEKTRIIYEKLIHE